ncbi:hypothetical protein ES288_D09G092400v1 [Gossypium darwinii]|uniref:Uncharacterized protein n=1 Tax=Gossypium darwinii TaxID=34276 RepID=A0A5D2B7D3_GOSDA|nr:hypothetical protein ES288_D09G092400v1 [Gossypium darwinii]
MQWRIFINAPECSRSPHKTLFLFPPPEREKIEVMLASLLSCENGPILYRKKAMEWSYFDQFIYISR